MLSVRKNPWVSIMFVAFLTGCASHTQLKDATTSGAQQSSSTQGTGEQNAMSSGATLGSEKVADLRSQRVFYFGFDEDAIQPSAYAALKAHAKFLAGRPNARVRLAGHTDERGTREYNLALGDRRANAVAQFLGLNGVSSAQMEIVSYGEEDPADTGHDETAWSQNRRVELVYTAQ